MAAKIGLLGAVAFSLLVAADDAAADELYGLGRPATPREIAGWNIDIGPDGSGLPAGHGNSREGEAIYEQKCASCHGLKGEGGPMDRLAGGFGTVFEMKSERTVGSFWPYATTLFDFIRRAMPLDAPQSLTADEVYAVCAYILSLNKIVPEGAMLDSASLPKIEMPNHAAFTSAFSPAAEPKSRSGARAPEEER
jgi:mono/diheme cytochrome c family protein